jgi:uncharacterized protein
MKPVLQPEIIKGRFSVTAYGPHFIEVNKVSYKSSCIISTETEPIPWEPSNAEEITQENVKILFKNRPDVVLIGTGKVQIFLKESIVLIKEENNGNPTAFLDGQTSSNKACADCMSTHAACRTFNLLAAEGRTVVAGLLI